MNAAPRPQSVPAIKFFAARDAGEIEDAVGDDLEMLDNVSGVADYTRYQGRTFGQLDVSSHLPLALVQSFSS